MARRTRRQALGQHFLKDEQVADRIVAAAGLGPDDQVLEIGPGYGVLTQRLMEAAPVAALEKDSVLAATLRARWGEEPNLEVIEGDALRLAWPDFTALVANLPYSVSTPLLLRLLELQAAWRVAVVMVQAEVARRLTSHSGAGYGRLSVAVGYRASAKLLFKVSRTAFAPQPRVHSAVVRLEPLERPPVKVADEAFFFSAVAKLFGHRRKTLRNCLRLAWPRMELEGLPNLDRRPEELTLAELAGLTDEVGRQLELQDAD